MYKVCHQNDHVEASFSSFRGWKFTFLEGQPSGLARGKSCVSDNNISRKYLRINWLILFSEKIIGQDFKSLSNFQLTLLKHSVDISMKPHFFKNLGFS